MDETRSRLIGCFSAVFPALDEAQIPQATKATVEKWDSLAAFSLLTVIEEEFQLQIEPEDVDRLDTFESILAYLRSRAATVD